MSAVDVALELLAMGLKPARLDGKRAVESGWPNIVHTEESVRREFRPADNVGALMGEPSGWIVDVDLDSEEAVRIAADILPATRTFGRKSKPRSHYLYRVRDAKTRKWVDAEHRMIVELRSTGCQTMMPGSTHPSGEPVEWRDRSEIVELDAHQLTAHLDRLALRCGWARPEPAARPQRPHAPTGEGYGATALREELARLGGTGEGGRNPMLNDVAFRIAQLVDAGDLPPSAMDDVRATALSTGLGAREVDRTMESARKGAAANPRAPRDTYREHAPMARHEPPPMRTGEELRAAGLGYVEELLADIRATQGRKVAGIPIPGFPLLTDALFGLRGSCLLTGPSGMGKTTLVNSIALNVARGHDMHGVDPHAPVPVVYVTAEMDRADIAKSMLSTLAVVPTRTLEVGDTNGDDGPDGLILRSDTRTRVEKGLAALRALEDGRALSILAASSAMRPWSRERGEHALAGLAEAAHELAGGKPMLVIVDTLATLDVRPSEGAQHRTELDTDADIVDALVAWRNALPAGSCILAVHEESKAATGTGDGHAVRGSSRYLFSTTQRLVMTYADGTDIGTRTVGVRGEADPIDGVAEIDMRVAKARGGGIAGTVIGLEHEYAQAMVREVGAWPERKLREVKRSQSKRGRRDD
jgi:KaiC/GvpD/RAD55 family RecA-like ATPase